MLGQKFISLSLGLVQKKKKLKSGYLELRFSVKAATLNFISGRGLAISSAKEGEPGFIYHLEKS